MSILDSPVSIYRNARDTHGVATMSVGEVLARIRTATFRDRITTLRHLKATDAAAYTQAKRDLYAFTPCCTLRTRDQKVRLADKLLSTTGIVHFDFDHVPDPAALKARLGAEPSLVFAFVSPGGDGLKTGFAAEGITDGESYKRAWHHVSSHLKATFPDATISEDPLIKYLNALCFVSDDPALYLNADAVPLSIPAGQPPDEDPPADSDQTPDEGAIPFATLAQAIWAIPCDDYAPWLTVGMALHAAGYQHARALWDAWSQQSTKYDQAVQDTKWTSFHADGGRHPGDLLTLAHQHG